MVEESTECPDGTVLDTVHNVKSGDEIPVVFHVVPVGGSDQVLVTAEYGDSAFMSAVSDVEVVPGTADHVDLQAGDISIPTGLLPVFVRMHDTYDNPVMDNIEWNITVESSRPDVVSVAESVLHPYSKGTALFHVNVTGGAPGDEAIVTAFLPGTGPTAC